MRICLIGYGKMGKTIETVCNQRGHTVSAVVSSSNKNQLADFLNDCDVAIEFTQPESALENILICFEHHTPVVSGTTGWTSKWNEMLHYQEQIDGALLWASNFSIGVNVLFEINTYLARIMKTLVQYIPSIEEIHHTHKKDCPSGTAVSLVQQIIAENSEYTKWNLSDEKSENDSIEIVAKREENVVGYHQVKYKSSIDELSISHNAYTREGFALGAVLAAEWIKGKSGVFTMKNVLGLNQS
ncbi:MAG: 4-hydroxy-tetrahydrodipicolinate reductase [Saprospiraceae bacterium]